MRNNSNSLQLDLLPFQSSIAKKDGSSTFAHNLSLPIHRWFRFTAGFSSLWVKELINKEKENGRLNVLDPFTGSGTVLIEAELANVNSMGIESHPFIARVARAKLYWKESPDDFLSFAKELLQRAKKRKSAQPIFPPLIYKCYPPSILSELDSIKQSWLAHADGSAQSELTWLVITSILRECSPVGTAQWQYIQPRKSKA
ncbi:MAG: methylase, partial [Bacteroidetes bacterium]|nr:methylase [Bacteroidota bacterium]